MAHYYIDPFSGKTKSNKYFHKQREKNKLKKLYDIGGDSWYPWPVVWSDYVYDWDKHCNFPAENAFLQRNWRGRRSRFYKTLGHRKLRRNKYLDITDKTYNKSYEFW